MALSLMFKSYYVVWKQRKDFMQWLTDEEFKSYYVVWKLMVKDEKTEIIGFGLNRTM